jgi:hypothetical protein
MALWKFYRTIWLKIGIARRFSVKVSNAEPIKEEKKITYTNV